MDINIINNFLFNNLEYIISIGGSIIIFTFISNNKPKQSSNNLRRFWLMVFEDVKSALSWYVTALYHGNAKIGAVSISETSGIDFSITNDGYDNVDTFCDIEKIIHKTLTKKEIKVIIHNSLYGLDDVNLPNGQKIKGSFRTCSYSIFRLFRKGKPTKISESTRKKYFRSYIKSAEKVLEKKMVEEGYIISN